MKTWKKNFEGLVQVSGGNSPLLIRRPLLFYLFFFICGILTGRYYIKSDACLPFIICFIIAFLIASLCQHGIKRVFCFSAVIFTAGVLLINSREKPQDLVRLTGGEKVIVEGTVLGPARADGSISRFELKAERLLIENSARHVNEKILVTVYKNADPIETGTRIRFPASLRPFMNFNNPGRYNYELSMELRMLACSASVSDGRYIVPVGKGNPGFLLETAEKLRSPVRTLINERLQRRDSALYRALILGEKEGITNEQREPFNITGMGHVLAVSGLHIGIVAWLFFVTIQGILRFSQRLALRFEIRKITAVITCIPVILYTGMTGFQVSGQRAMIMALTYLVSIIIGREKDVWSTLALAALIVLAFDPAAVQSISFQLSFLAVTGILLFTPFIHGLISISSQKEHGSKILFFKIWFYFSGIIAASLSAVIFLLPVTVCYFHRISAVSIAANLAVIPLLAFIILPAGILASLSLIVSPFIAGMFLEAGAAGLRLMIKIIELFAGLSWASFWMVTPAFFEILIFYSLLFSLLYIRKYRRIKYLFFIMLLLAVSDIGYWLYQVQFNRNLKVTFIDVGQGSSALVRFPGNKRMLIDGGGFRTGTFDTGKSVVAPYLYSRKILAVDYVVLTHPHPDHMNGLRFIASDFSPSEFWFNGDNVDVPEFRELMGIVKSRHIPVYTPRNLPDELIISGVNVEILNPFEELIPHGSNDGRAVNNNSMVLRMTFNGKSILFAADIEQDTESRMVEKYGSKLKSDVLFVPHHGSRYSSTESFLEMVKPDISVISSRKGNRFGFPHAETLERLESEGSRVLRIDEKGAVEIITGQGLLDVRCYSPDKFMNMGTCAE